MAGPSVIDTSNLRPSRAARARDAQSIRARRTRCARSWARSAAARPPDRVPASGAGRARASFGRASRGARGRNEAVDGRGLRGGDVLSSLRRRRGRRTPPPPITVRVCAPSLPDGRRRCASGGRGSRVRPRRARDRRAVHRPLRACARRGRRPAARRQRYGGEIAAAVAGRQTRADIPAYVDFAAYRAAGGYRTYAAAAIGERTPDEVIAALEDSALRGLGGAGFPVGRKWRSSAPKKRRA